MAEADPRPVAPRVLDRERLGLEEQRTALLQLERDQVLADLRLRVHQHGAAAGEGREVDPVPFPFEAQFDPVVPEPLAVHPLAGPGGAQGVDGPLFQDSGALPALHVRPVAALQHHGVDPRVVQQPCQQQSGRPGSDDPDGGPHPARPFALPAPAGPVASVHPTPPVRLVNLAPPTPDASLRKDARAVNGSRRTPPAGHARGGRVGRDRERSEVPGTGLEPVRPRGAARFKLAVSAFHHPGRPWAPRRDSEPIGARSSNSGRANRCCLILLTSEGASATGTGHPHLPIAFRAARGRVCGMTEFHRPNGRTRATAPGRSSGNAVIPRYDSAARGPTGGCPGNRNSG